MQKNKKIVYFIFSIVCLFIGCTKSLDVPLDSEVQGELVLSCFFSTNDFEFNLSKLRPILKPELMPEEEAHVELWNNGELINVLSHTSNGEYNYTGPTLIPGEEYNIKVQAEEKNIIATTTLPLRKTTIDAATEYFVQSADGNEYIDVSFQISDPLEDVNYYEFLILQPYYDEQKDSTLLRYLHDVAIPDAVLDREGDLIYDPSSFVLSDFLFDGQSYEMQLRFENSAAPGRCIGGKYRNNESEYYLIFRSISEDYYLFRKSWFRHRYNQSTGDQFNNGLQLLFGSEPLPLFSNVSNGLGVFGAYHEVIVPIQEL